MRPAGVTVLTLLLGASRLSGQVDARLDAGFGSIGPLARTATGRLTGGWLLPLSGSLSAELTGTVQGQRGAGLTSALAGWGGGRLHLARGAQGVWVGYQRGQDFLGPVTRWEGGAWKRMGQFSLQLQGWQTATLLSERADTAGVLPDTLNPRSPTTTSARSTTDLAMWLNWARGRTEVSLASGLRFGMRELAGSLAVPGDGGRGGRRVMLSSTWWMAEGTWWLHPRLGMVGSVGRRPIDPAVSARGEEFLRLGFRAAVMRRGVRPPLVPGAAATGFWARRLDGPLVQFRISAPAGTARVELMADFTSWEGVPLQREGAFWVVSLAAEPGVHRVQVRYDGGAWQAPPAVRSVTDEFGTETGEIVLR